MGISEWFEKIAIGGAALGVLAMPIRAEASPAEETRPAERAVFEADATINRPEGEDFFETFAAKFSRGDFSLRAEATRQAGTTGMSLEFKGCFSSTRLGFAAGAPIDTPAFAKVTLGRAFGRFDLTGQAGIEGGAPSIDFSLARSFENYAVSIEASHNADGDALTFHLEFTPRF